MDRSRGNLPVEFSSFVGRDGEVAEGLRGIGAARLLTVTGPGGVGKTRVATRVATRARRAFPGGVWYAELSSVTGADALIDHVAAACGHPERRTPEGLATALGQDRALLVLDTCEHLLGPVAALVATVLRWTPKVKVLATSRQPLGLDGERVLDVRVMSPAESLALFADRALAADPAFDLTPSVRQAAEDVCRSLDGLPLAIELAAGCLRTLSPEDLSARLERNCPALAEGNTNALARHRDLRALVEWSHALCGAEQRSLWAALSVVRGPMDLAVAEAIGTEAGLPGVRVARVLADLVNASIVVREPGGYRLLRPFRDLGLELLDERDRVRLGARYGSRGAEAPPGRPRRSGGPALSARELEVALLVTEGLTNQEIAGRLVISKRTVDAHVRNILAKSHLSSRTHLAAWVSSSGYR
ncbi:LuxR C-terminal-related transcriptional regulator [Nonomuraea sp. NPDC050556]|uniref:LuxR C-terminal-related transcriptional regulator n=1 Tax=Nonomuraea sp. NPDC050556 TaxID=3364369 RepID=UPI00378EEC24